MVFKIIIVATSAFVAVAFIALSKSAKRGDELNSLIHKKELSE